MGKGAKMGGGSWKGGSGNCLNFLKKLLYKVLLENFIYRKKKNFFEFREDNDINGNLVFYVATLSVAL